MSILTGMPSVTTIKVPVEVRDRVAARARRDGTTAAAVISSLLDAAERAERMREVASAYEGGADDDYTAELALWEQVEDDAGPRR